MSSVCYVGRVSFKEKVDILLKHGAGRIYHLLKFSGNDCGGYLAFGIIDVWSLQAGV